MQSLPLGTLEEAIAINRWQGNSGRVVRYDDSPAPAPDVPVRNSVPQKSADRNMSGRNPAPLSELSRLTQLLPDRIGELETEDIILLLILYLMYRESGDSELLIIMGGMFLL